MWMNPILQIFRERGMLLVPLLSYAKAIESSKKCQCCTFACLKTFGLCNCANSQKLDVRQGWNYKPARVDFSSKKAGTTYASSSKNLSLKVFLLKSEYYIGCNKEFPLFDEGFTGPRLCKPWFASAGMNGELGTTCKACL